MHIILAAVDIHAGRKRTFEKQPIEQNWTELILSTVEINKQIKFFSVTSQPVNWKLYDECKDIYGGKKSSLFFNESVYE